jgi:hypothetical protein
MPIEKSSSYKFMFLVMVVWCSFIGLRSVQFTVSPSSWEAPQNVSQRWRYHLLLALTNYNMPKPSFVLKIGFEETTFKGK